MNSHAGTEKSPAWFFSKLAYLPSRPYHFWATFAQWRMRVTSRSTAQVYLENSCHWYSCLTGTSQCTGYFAELHDKVSWNHTFLNEKYPPPPAHTLLTVLQARLGSKAAEVDLAVTKGLDNDLWIQSTSSFLPTEFWFATFIIKLPLTKLPSGFFFSDKGKEKTEPSNIPTGSTLFPLVNVSIFSLETSLHASYNRLMRTHCESRNKRSFVPQKY